MGSLSSTGLLFFCVYVLCICFETVHAFQPRGSDIPRTGITHAAMKEYEKSQDKGGSLSDEDWDPVHFFPPLDYVPHPVGVPYPMQDQSTKPWDRQKSSPVSHKALSPQQQGGQCSGTTGEKQGTANAGSTYWYEAIEHNGQSSFLSDQYRDNYKVFRNVVKDYGADNTGGKDASEAIEKAIKDGPPNGPSRDSHSMGSTGQPAIVYLPGGTYRMDKCVQFYIGTVLVGDPQNPPVLKASNQFPNDHVVYAKDPNFGGTVNFYLGLKNVIIDSTDVDPNKRISLLDWTVSQSTQLSNVVFKMPRGAEGHVGLTTEYDYNSNIIMNDLEFHGGNIGMNLAGQQWVFKGLTFQGTKTGVVTGGTDIVFLGCTFQDGELGIDGSGASGSLTVVDTKGSNMGKLIMSGKSGKASNAIILDNVQNTGSTVNVGGQDLLTGNVESTWVHGNLYTPGNSNVEHDNGRKGPTNRAQELIAGGKDYFTMKPPTYKEFTVDEVINVKSVQGLPVYGDGSTDDTDNINTILSMYAGCKIMYFPAGTYIVSNTIFVPAGSRIIGDTFASVISGVGKEFANEHNPRPMVRVGYPGDTGIGQITDMMLTVADVLPGCKMAEINMAGQSPGDVGLWNTHFRIGGAAGSQVQTKCGGSPCKAAWGLLHLTKSSSVYIENMWGWTADHDLDGKHTQNIATGRGLLVEATKGTWLVGTGFEHHTLYQYSFQRAQNVFSAMQQSESAYWQGPGNDLAPKPWDNSLTDLDPHFDHCDSGDSLCRMGFFEIIHGSSNLFLYGGCNWVFFNNNGDCQQENCQKNAIQIEDSNAVYLYGTNTKSTENIVLEGSQVIAKQADNAGGWGGVIAAYLYDV